MKIKFDRILELKIYVYYKINLNNKWTKNKKHFYKLSLQILVQLILFKVHGNKCIQNQIFLITHKILGIN